MKCEWDPTLDNDKINSKQRPCPKNRRKPLEDMVNVIYSMWDKQETRLTNGEKPVNFSFHYSFLQLISMAVGSKGLHQLFFYHRETETKI